MYAYVCIKTFKIHHEIQRPPRLVAGFQRLSQEQPAGKPPALLWDPLGFFLFLLPVHQQKASTSLLYFHLILPSGKIPGLVANQLGALQPWYRFWSVGLSWCLPWALKAQRLWMTRKCLLHSCKKLHTSQFKFHRQSLLCVPVYFHQYVVWMSLGPYTGSLGFLLVYVS